MLPNVFVALKNEEGAEGKRVQEMTCSLGGRQCF
jgi:hypothetical protein